jgi:hypothetical protein
MLIRSIRQPLRTGGAVRSNPHPVSGRQETNDRAQVVEAHPRGESSAQVVAPVRTQIVQFKNCFSDPQAGSTLRGCNRPYRP